MVFYLMIIVHGLAHIRKYLALLDHETKIYKMGRATDQFNRNQVHFECLMEMLVLFQAHRVNWMVKICSFSCQLSTAILSSLTCKFESRWMNTLENISMFWCAGWVLYVFIYISISKYKWELIVQDVISFPTGPWSIC